MKVFILVLMACLAVGCSTAQTIESDVPAEDRLFNFLFGGTDKDKEDDKDDTYIRRPYPIPYQPTRLPNIRVVLNLPYTTTPYPMQTSTTAAPPTSSYSPVAPSMGLAPSMALAPSMGLAPSMAMAPSMSLPPSISALSPDLMSLLPNLLAMLG